MNFIRHQGCRVLYVLYVFMVSTLFFGSSTFFFPVVCYIHMMIHVCPHYMTKWLVPTYPILGPFLVIMQLQIADTKKGKKNN